MESEYVNGHFGVVLEQSILLVMHTVKYVEGSLAISMEAQMHLQLQAQGVQQLDGISITHGIAIARYYVN